MRLVVAGIMICFSSLSSFAGQEECGPVAEGGAYTVEKSMTLILGTPSNQVPLVSFTVDWFVIYATQSAALQSLSDMIEPGRRQPGISALLSWITEELPNDVVSLNEYTDGHNMLRTYLMMHLIENGQAFVLDSKNQEYISEVKLELYSCSKEGARLDGGRLFRTANGSKIIALTDWIA